MRTIKLLLLLILHSCSLFAQDKYEYFKLIGQAEQFYQVAKFRESGETYHQAFVKFKTLVRNYDRYNASCAWALAGQTDSAFAQLFAIAETGKQADVKHLSSDEDLKTLHADPRWKNVVSQLSLNNAKAQAKFDKDLVVQLDSIYEDDQKYRMMLDEIESKHGWQSPQVKALWDTIRVKDSLNLVKVAAIIDKHGWLGADVVGNRGNQALFLVIQHSPHKIQKKYLPMMREAAKKGNAQPSDLALLEDRVAIGNGEKQIFGSQIGRHPQTGKYYVMPLLDPDNVDKRRAEANLTSLKDYVSIWGMEWDVEEYKRNLPEYEQLYQKK